MEQQNRDGVRKVLYRPAGIELGASQSGPPRLSTDGPGTAAASESAGAESWAARKACQLPGTGWSLIGWAARLVTHRVGRSSGRLRLVASCGHLSRTRVTFLKEIWGWKSATALSMSPL